MALTRKLLKGMGLTEEQIDTVIEAHTETTDALKNERDSYKKDAEKLPGVQQELDDLKAAGDDGGFQAKYEKEHADFEAYKTEQAKKESRAAKEKAYRDLLKSARISEKRVESVLKVSDLDSIELDENGAIKDADKLTESIKTEWADFIVTTTTKGAETASPPASTAGKIYTRDDLRKMSPEEINQNWDAVKASLGQKGE